MGVDVNSRCGHSIRSIDALLHPAAFLSHLFPPVSPLTSLSFRPSYIHTPTHTHNKKILENDRIKERNIREALKEENKAKVRSEKKRKNTHLLMSTQWTISLEK